ncbi:MAG: T9SS type A sorting domain-containing protein, partial [Bacteroidota bacterium]
PNPFNPTTTIRYDLPSAGLVSLEVFDILGREVRTLVNEKLQAGSYERTFDASGLASGVYFYRLNAGPFLQTRKFILAK